jgi:hypothetical protein
VALVSEADERLPVGPRGVQGKQGETGEQGKRGEGITHGTRRAIVTLFALMTVFAVANLLYTSSQVGHVSGVVRTQDAQSGLLAGQVRKLETAVLASCAFAADVGTVPLPAAPKPSRLGVSLIADSRLQWRELGCPGSLAPPTPSFTHWARYYGLPAT